MAWTITEDNSKRGMMDTAEQDNNVQDQFESLDELGTGTAQQTDDEDYYKSADKAAYPKQVREEIDISDEVLKYTCDILHINLEDWESGDKARRQHFLRELVRCRDSGDEYISKQAMNVAYYTHVRFIYNVVMGTYGSYARASQWHMENLLQAGSYGFAQSFTRYNPEYMLTTYAKNNIKHYCGLYIAKEIYNTTAYRNTHITMISRAEQELSRNGIMDPTPTQISAVNGLDIAKVEKALEVRKSSQTRELTENMLVESSIKTRNEHEMSPLEQTLDREQTEILMQALDSLPQDEHDVIVRKYGIGMKEMTNAQIHADLPHIPLENIRHLIQHGTTLLRRNMELRDLYKDLFVSGRKRLAKLAVVGPSVSQEILDGDRQPEDKVIVITSRNRDKVRSAIANEMAAKNSKAQTGNTTPV